MFRALVQGAYQLDKGRLRPCLDCFGTWPVVLLNVHWSEVVRQGTQFNQWGKKRKVCLAVSSGTVNVLVLQLPFVSRYEPDSFIIDLKHDCRQVCCTSVTKHMPAHVMGSAPASCF